MGTPYAGTPVFSNTILLPDDGSAIHASSVNVPFEGAQNSLQYLKLLADNNTNTPVYQEFLTSGSITIPANAASFALVEASGGGGAGGTGGAHSNTHVQNVTAGGGGGGGAIREMRIVPLIPGETYNVVIGAGGITNGFGIAQPGGDTKLVRQTGLVTIETWMGAEGGLLGVRCDVAVENMPRLIGAEELSSNQYSVAKGGRPTRSGTSYAIQPSPFAYPTPETPSHGAHGVSNNWQQGLDLGSVFTPGLRGNSSVHGFDGGIGGDSGANIGTSHFGGGPGGGGGGGGWGVGGAGGDGSNATNPGQAPDGGDGAAAADNSGAGGGGGGGAGAGDPLNGAAGGTGGNGGSGRMRILYWVPMLAE